MQGTTAAFQAALLKSHTIVTRAEILYEGSVVRVLDEVIGGTVNVEATAAVRRRCSVRIVDSTGDLVPTGTADDLYPNGSEIRLYRGVRLSTGDELVPLGTFRIGRTKVIDTPGGLVIDVNGYDRARSVQRNRFIDPYSIASGANIGTAIQALITDRLPGTTYNFPTISASTTAAFTFLEGEDPWRKATEMAESVGASLFFDPLGICTLRPSSNTADVVASFTEGETATFLDVERDLDDEKTYNAVVATGEAPTSTAPVRAVAYDANPTSPTYYLGPYGLVPFFYSSPFIGTTTQAQDAANARLQKVIGATEAVRISIIPNPALDADDVVQIVRARSGVGGTGNPFFVVDDLAIPLEADRPMTIATRERRSLS